MTARSKQFAKQPHPLIQWMHQRQLVHPETDRGTGYFYLRWNDMNPYYLEFEVKPRPGNTQAAGIESGYCEIWVFASSLAAAKDSALRYIERYRWEVTAEISARKVPPDMIAGLDTMSAVGYRSAENRGIFAHFHGRSGNKSDGFEVRFLTDFDKEA